MRSPRVLHISPALFRSSGGVVGGAERYVLELARNMAGNVPTRLVSFGNRQVQEQIGLLDIQVLGPAWYIRDQRLNPIHLSLIRHVWWADVVHCHQQFVVASTIALILSRLSGRRAFVTDHGGGGFDLSAFLPVDRWYTGYLHQSRYALEVYGHSNWPKARIIYGGVDLNKFSHDGSVQKEPLVVYVGRLLPHKGVNNLIDALPAGLHLEIIGQAYDEKYFADLQAIASQKPIVFRTDCDDIELLRAYRRALCIVLPSVYRDLYGNETKVPELLGQTLLEGMACGIPAICTNVASMPEIVVDGVTGFIVPPNDPKALGEKLAWLRDHPDEARAMGAAGRKRVEEKFTWPRVVNRCLQIYGLNGSGKNGDNK